MQYRFALVIAAAVALSACAARGGEPAGSEAQATGPDRPSLSLDVSVVHVGDVVSLTIHGPDGYIYGNDAYIEVQESGEWRRLYLLGTGRGGGGYQALDENGQLPPGMALTQEGYMGDVTIKIIIPPLEPGTYRLAKDFIRDGDGTIEDRTTLATATLVIEEG